MDRRTFLGVGLGALAPWSAASWSWAMPSEQRMRARSIGIVIGFMEPGPLNAITDVPGVRVGHVTLVSGEGPLVVGEGPVRTGVTAILPHGGMLSKEACHAADFTLNGNGELTGVGLVRQADLLPELALVRPLPSVAQSRSRNSYACARKRRVRGSNAPRAVT